MHDVQERLNQYRKTKAQKEDKNEKIVSELAEKIVNLFIYLDNFYVYKYDSDVLVIFCYSELSNQFYFVKIKWERFKKKRNFGRKKNFIINGDEILF